MAWLPKPLIVVTDDYLMVYGGNIQPLVPGSYCVFAILGFSVAAEMRSVVVENATFTRAMHVAVRQFGFKVMGFFQFCLAAAERTGFQCFIHFFPPSDCVISLSLVPSFDNLDTQEFSRIPLNKNELLLTPDEGLQ